MQLAALGAQHVMGGTTKRSLHSCCLEYRASDLATGKGSLRDKTVQRYYAPPQLLTTINQAILLHFHCMFEVLSGMQSLSATPSRDEPRMSSVLINFATMLTVIRSCYPR